MAGGARHARRRRRDAVPLGEASTTTTRSLQKTQQHRHSHNHPDGQHHHAPTQQRRGLISTRTASSPSARQSVSSAVAQKRSTLPAAATTWRYPDPQEWVASDDELARRRKKPRLSALFTTPKPVFAIAPTRRDRALNRKKLSSQAKQKLKRAARDVHARVAPAFSRGSSASVRKLLTLELGASDLAGDLAAFAQFVALTPDERAFRQRTFREIREVIRAVFPDATVELYGSSSSGMETFRSDLDITVGNLDFSRLRHHDAYAQTETPAAVSESEEEDAENENEINRAGYVVSDTDDGSGSDNNIDDDDEPTFSLNLSLPGQATTTPFDGLRPSPMVAASTALKSPWNPTLRRQKMRQLRALQQLLQTQRPQLTIQCLSKAKIPILMMVDRASGLQIDLGVNREAFHASDHGRTTALVAQLQQALGAPFFAIVVFLKEFLHQFELDKPFTGGLGSYRLYMMVAYIFTTRFAPASRSTSSNPKKRKASPLSVSPATVLLTFLEVFSNRQKRGFFTVATELPVRHDGLLDVVRFNGVFRLDDVVDKFAMALDIVSKQRALGGVVFEDALESERRASAKRILQQLERDEQQQRRQQQPQQQQRRHAHADAGHEEASDESSDYEDERFHGE